MTVSLRKRILLGTAVGTTVILLASGAALYAMMASSLQSEFDLALLAKARTLANLIERESDGFELEFVEAQMSEFKRTERPEYFQVWLADGTELARSPSLGRDDLPFVSDSATDESVQPLKLPDGSAGRMSTICFYPRLEDGPPDSRDNRQLILALARDTRDIRAAMQNLRWAMLVAGLVAVGLSALILDRLVRVGLRPANQLADAIGALDVDGLVSRLNTGNAPPELRSIAERINELLTRLGEAFDRERAMTANVAHELRTPLAGLRSTIDVAMSRDRTGSEYHDALSRCAGMCLQMQALIENLLMLARLDAGAATVTTADSNVSELIHSVWESLSPSAKARDLDVRLNVAEKLMARTDSQMLRVVTRNLIDNAICHSPAGGAISIEASKTDGEINIRVTNSGSKVPSDAAHHVFDRFWRGDASRTHSNGHSGLGLTLCKTIVNHLGGRIEATSELDGPFSIRVTCDAQAESP